ncbi:hypothetical protein [Anaeromyxobacter dehalogenans]|uniref:hypothetical protein n=1 Tax=Anaeromyxobacter dehalogenans TaxID=161493 RepID=UPI001FDF8CC5|nr:hypothetical protein [Anaeromyxobacter dehalogenans]
MHVKTAAILAWFAASYGLLLVVGDASAWLAAGLLAWAVAVPVLVHRSAWPLAFFVSGSLVLGVVMAAVFQLVHAVPEAQLQGAPGADARAPTGWAEHQVRTTVDFARSSRVLAWYLGGPGLPDRAPPLPRRLPRALPGARRHRRGDVPHARVAVPRAAVALGRGGRAPPSSADARRAPARGGVTAVQRAGGRAGPGQD